MFMSNKKANRIIHSFNHRSLSRTCSLLILKMRFTSVAMAALAVAVNASPVPLNTEGASNVQYGQAIGEAVEGAIAAVNGIKNWNKVSWHNNFPPQRLL